MRWQGGRRGGGIEDRRGMGGGAVAGGGIGVLVLAAIGYFVFGIDPNTTQQVASQFGGASQSEQAGKTGTPEDQAGQFVEVVGTNINDVWKTKLGASGADFAKAYVIAHEFGHHVQHLTGATDQVQRAQQSARSQAEGNKYSVALELQADCYAGVWARNAAAVSNGQVALEPGDLEEGMKTAQAIGDDTLQRRGGGRVSPESFTHGSSAQRVEWLQRGYQTGDPASCDTFKGL